MAGVVERSPLALYLLAAMAEWGKGHGPWRVEDDPEDLFRVVLSGRNTVVEVKVLQRMSGTWAQIEVEGASDGWAAFVRNKIEFVLSGVYIVGERQLTWYNRTRRGTETPDRTDER